MHRSGGGVAGCILMIVVALVLVTLSVATGSRAILLFGGLAMAAVGGLNKGIRKGARARLGLGLSADERYLVLRGGCEEFADAVHNQQEGDAYDLAHALHVDGMPSAAIVQELVNTGWIREDA